MKKIFLIPLFSILLSLFSGPTFAMKQKMDIVAKALACIPKKDKCIESILRLDHIQPIGAHHDSHKLLDYKLSDSALEIIDELIGWMIWGGVREDSLIKMYRDEMEALFP